MNVVENKIFKIKDYDYWYGSGPQTIQVLEDEKTSHDTGLLDKNGNKIMKRVKLEKIGYY